MFCSASRVGDGLPSGVFDEVGLARDVGDLGGVRDAVVCGGGGEGGAEEFVFAIDGIISKGGDGVFDGLAGGELREGDEGGEPGGEVGVVDDTGLEEEVDSIGIKGEGFDGIAAQGGVGGEEGGAVGAGVEFFESVEGPNGVESADAGLSGEILEGGGGVGFISIDEESLGGEAPELVGIGEGVDELSGGRAIEGGDF